MPDEVISSMVDVSKRFFEQPYEERAKYMSSDMASPVRYGTSFNQSKDKVFCWRDFLKITCQPTSQVLPHWPSSPADLRYASYYPPTALHPNSASNGLRSSAVEKGRLADCESS